SQNPTPTYIYTLSLHDALPILDESERTAGGRAHSGRVLRFGCFSDDLLREQALVAVSQLRVYRRYRSWTWLYRSGRRAGEMVPRSEEHTSELQSRFDLVCRLLL